jgi:hypothetical protein
MRSVTLRVLAALCGLALLAAPALTADSTAGMMQGTPDLKSAGPLAFGPDGILFVGDPAGAAIFAIDTGDKAATGKGHVKVAKIDQRMASLVGTTPADLNIADMAVNPASGNVYFSVGRGRGPEASPALIRLDRKGDVTEIPLKDVKFSKAVLPNPKTQFTGRGSRTDVLTNMAYIDGKLFVAGLSNEEFASKLRVIQFPFRKVDRGASIEIYHGAHGKLETNAPVRTLTPFEIAGEAQLLCAYTCTPLVRIPVAQLKDGEKVKGVTVAELGNRNQPLDMVPYNKDGKDYLLIANSARGVMKVDLSKVGTVESISTRINDTAGLQYETVKDLKGVVQLSRLDAGHALALVKDGNSHNLETIHLP